MRAVGNNVVKKTYIYANSQIIAQHDGDTDAEIYYYLHDRLGSVRQMIDTSGNVVNRYTYGLFGKWFIGEVQETKTNNFCFTGQYCDREILQYHMRARQYDININRFTSRDPVLGESKEPMTMHAYLYCINDPVNKVDPSGLWELGLRYYIETEMKNQDAYRLSDAEIEAQYGAIWRNPSRKTFHGHSDFGYLHGDFDYTRLDRQLWTNPYVRPDLHFMSLEEATWHVNLAIRSGDAGHFELAMHTLQDYFSHRGKGYSPYGHLKALHEPDYPYTPNPRDPDDKRYLQTAYRQAQRWTKKYEDLWYLIWDTDKWLSLP